MRKPTYLSYSSYSLFKLDPDEFYLKHLAEVRPPKVEQTAPMGVGSAFDAFVKSELNKDLGTIDPNLCFETLFEAQVEEHNRGFCHRAGQHSFEAYVQSGAYGDLLKVLESADAIRFETSVEGVIDGVPILGKPDLRFMIGNLRVILDWKVKQYCSKNSASPTPGFALCRDGYDAIAQQVKRTSRSKTYQQSKSHGTSHDLYLPMEFGALEINQGYMEQYSDDYAAQLSLYGWILGEPPGDEEVVVWIEELCCKPYEPEPLIRVANHRSRVGRQFQLDLLNGFVECWDAISTGHIFKEKTREENDEHCRMLEAIAANLTRTDEHADWFNSVTRPQFKR